MSAGAVSMGILPATYCNPQTDIALHLCLQAQATEALSQVKGAAAGQVPEPGQAGAAQQPSKLDIVQGFAQLHMNADDQVGHQVGCGRCSSQAFKHCTGRCCTRALMTGHQVACKQQGPVAG